MELLSFLPAIAAVASAIGVFVSFRAVFFKTRAVRHLQKVFDRMIQERQAVDDLSALRNQIAHGKAMKDEDLERVSRLIEEAVKQLNEREARDVQSGLHQVSPVGRMRYLASFLKNSKVLAPPPPGSAVS